MNTPPKRRTALSPTVLYLLRWGLYGMVFAFGLSLLWFYVVGQNLFSDGVVGPVTTGDFLLLAGIALGAAVGWVRRRD